MEIIMIERKTKFKICSFAFVLLILAGLVWLLLSDKGNYQIIKSVFTNDLSTEEIQETLRELGIRGYATIAVLSMLQVIFTFMPSEPTQVISGAAFGIPVGLLCCMVGVFLGNTIIYLLYKYYGNSIREYFVKNVHVDFDKISKSKRLTFIVLILYVLPVIPYGMICFIAASFGMKYPRYIWVTLLGSIPSECMGIALGHVAVASSWVVSVIIFAVIVALLIAVMLKRDAIFKRVNEYIDQMHAPSKTKVKKYKPIRLFLPHIISRVIMFMKGVKVIYKYKVKDIEKPSIVLANHGSFIDFVYAGTMLRKKAPNFIMARLYFYRLIVANFVRSFGCFPKSMFTADLESAKNCLRVLKNDGVLAMMPEARLSTAGRFEDIQEGTFAFLKKNGVPIYTVKIEGDYFAKPKWGDKMRRGAVVEAELDILLTADEVREASVEEIKARVIDRLYYDEFEWIKKHENLRYKSKTLAVGLENILSTCPRCHGKYTLRTDKRDILCEKCGRLATIDDRYSFTEKDLFNNFGEWYDWQYREMEKEIRENPDYALRSRVKLRTPSLDGKTMLRDTGEGVCTLTRDGLTYVGTVDGEETELHFPIKNIYRLLFGAGENFEVYVGPKIYYFVPEIKQSCVDWYIVSRIIYDMALEPVDA